MILLRRIFELFVVNEIFSFSTILVLTILLFEPSKGKSVMTIERGGTGSGVITTQSQQQYFITRPRDIEVIEGTSTIELECQVGNLMGRVQWSKDGFLLGYEAEIRGFPRYSMSMDPSIGRYNLIVRNVVLEDEGDYQCQVGPGPNNNRPIRAGAKVTMIIPPTKITMSPFYTNNYLPIETTKISIPRLIYISNNNSSNQHSAAVQSYKEHHNKTAISSFHKGHHHRHHNHHHHKHASKLLNQNNKSSSASSSSNSSNHSVVQTRELTMIEVSEGEKIMLKCRTMTPTKPATTISWFRIGVTINKSSSNYDIRDRITQEVTNEFDSRDLFTTESTIYLFVKLEDRPIDIKCSAHHPAIDSFELDLFDELRISVLTAPSRPEIEGYSKGEILSAGDKVTLACMSRGGNPTPSLIWYRENEIVDATSSTTSPRNNASSSGPSSSSSLIATTNTYSFIVKPEDNRRTFKCEASNLIATTSNEIKLDVRFLPLNIKLKGPTVGRINDILRYECLVGPSNPIPNSIVWSINGLEQKYNGHGSGGYPIDSWFENSTFGYYSKTNITVLLSESIKTISCSSTSNFSSSSSSSSSSKTSSSNSSSDHDKDLTTISASINVHILYKPEFPSTNMTKVSSSTFNRSSKDVQNVISTIDIVEGSNDFSISLPAKGNPSTIHYYWSKDGVPLTTTYGSKDGSKDNSKDGRIFVNSSTLWIRSVTRHDDGIYSIRAANTEGSTTTTFRLNVLYGSFIERTFPTTREVIVRPNSASFVNLTCFVNPGNNGASSSSTSGSSSNNSTTLSILWKVRRRKRKSTSSPTKSSPKVLEPLKRIESQRNSNVFVFDVKPTSTLKPLQSSSSRTRHSGHVSRRRDHHTNKNDEFQMQNDVNYLDEYEEGEESLEPGRSSRTSSTSHRTHGASKTSHEIPEVDDDYIRDQETLDNDDENVVYDNNNVNNVEYDDSEYEEKVLDPSPSSSNSNTIIIHEKDDDDIVGSTLNHPKLRISTLSVKWNDRKEDEHDKDDDDVLELENEDALELSPEDDEDERKYICLTFNGIGSSRDEVEFSIKRMKRPTILRSSSSSSSRTTIHEKEDQVLLEHPSSSTNNKINNKNNSRRRTSSRINRKDKQTSSTTSTKNQISSSSSRILLEPSYVAIDGTEPYIELSCKSTGRPLPTISWYDDQNSLIQTSSSSSSSSRTVLEPTSNLNNNNNRFVVSNSKIETIELFTDYESSSSIDGSIKSSVSSKREFVEIVTSTLMMKHPTIDDVSRRFKCVAMNEIGKDVLEHFIRRKGIPDPPKNLQILKSSWNSLHLKWSEGFDGGFDQWFVIRINGNSKEIQVDSNEIVLEGLSGGQEYSIEVRSANSPFGVSSESVATVVTTPEKLPESPESNMADIDVDSDDGSGQGQLIAKSSRSSFMSTIYHMASTSTSVLLSYFGIGSNPTLNGSTTTSVREPSTLLLILVISFGLLSILGGILFLILIYRRQKKLTRTTTTGSSSSSSSTSSRNKWTESSSSTSSSGSSSNSSNRTTPDDSSSSPSTANVVLTSSSNTSTSSSSTEQNVVLTSNNISSDIVVHRTLASTKEELEELDEKVVLEPVLVEHQPFDTRNNENGLFLHRTFDRIVNKKNKKKYSSSTNNKSCSNTIDRRTSNGHTILFDNVVDGSSIGHLGYSISAENTKSENQVYLEREPTNTIRTVLEPTTLFEPVFEERENTNDLTLSSMLTMSRRGKSNQSNGHINHVSEQLGEHFTFTTPSNYSEQHSMQNIPSGHHVEFVNDMSEVGGVNGVVEGDGGCPHHSMISCPSCVIHSSTTNHPHHNYSQNSTTTSNIRSSDFINFSNVTSTLFDLKESLMSTLTRGSSNIIGSDIVAHTLDRSSNISSKHSSNKTRREKIFARDSRRSR